MKVNGKEQPLLHETSLMDFLLSCKFDPERVAVERNGEIVSKKSFDSVLLENSDVLEIVRFVGGG